MSPRAWPMVLVGLLPVLVFTAAARADERADAIAEELGRSGLYITDHAAREITAADAPRLRAILARVPGRTFLAVTPSVGLTREPLIALLHDRVGVDGVYIVMAPDGGDLVSVSFGPGNLPVTEAVYATIGSVAYDAGPLAYLRRFVDVLTSGRAAELAAKARHAKEPQSHSDRRDQVRNWVEVGSTAVGTVASIAVADWWFRRRRRARRSAPAPGPAPAVAGRASARARSGSR